MLFQTLLPGRAYRFLYPSINFRCLPSKMDERRMLVMRVRDTELEPLDEETLDANPFINRGRWLVTGTDLDKIEERSFYVESMVAVMDVTTRIPERMIRDISRSQNDEWRDENAYSESMTFRDSTRHSSTTCTDAERIDEFIETS